MAFFLFIGIDHAPHSMPLRERHRPEHRRYLFANDKDLVMVGIMEDDAGNQCGTTYLFDVEREQDVWQWLEKEPFWKEGVYASGKVVRWSMVLNRRPEKDWSDLRPMNPA